VEIGREGRVMNRITMMVIEFLTNMGIPPNEQHSDYRMEIAYRMGYEDGVRNYAIWNNGEQLVGAMRRPLKTVLAEFKNEEVPLRY
jgi:hypothetical protein